VDLGAVDYKRTIGLVMVGVDLHHLGVVSVREKVDVMSLQVYWCSSDLNYLFIFLNRLVR
jgi:hypothetical protein